MLKEWEQLEVPNGKTMKNTKPTFLSGDVSRPCHANEGSPVRGQLKTLGSQLGLPIGFPGLQCIHAGHCDGTSGRLCFKIFKVFEKW